MGSHGDGGALTQKDDDLVSPPTFSGHEIKDSDMMTTSPLDDTVLFDEDDDTVLLDEDDDTFLLDDDDDTVSVRESQAVNLAFETQEIDLVGETQVVDFDDGTQLVDFCGETQAVDFHGETQVLDFDGETQPLDLECEMQQLDDFDCNENIRTQVLSDYDDELFGNCDDILDDEAIQSIDQLVDQERVHFTSHRELDEKCDMQGHDDLTNEEHSSEPHVTASTPAIQGPAVSKSGPLRFTLIRSASLRASGLAVRNMNKKKTIHAESSILTENHPSESLSVATDGAHFMLESCKHGGEISEQHDHGIHNENRSRLRNENKCRVGSSTARKLFVENTCSNDSGTLHNTETIRNKSLLEVPLFDYQVSGLSYVHSQEPGEFSQSNALDFVDRFIETNINECDLDISLGKDTLEKSKSVSKIKGPQSLAKNAKDKSTVEKSRVFEWDDSREDEGGGEIFCRRKEEFFNETVGSLSCTQSRKVSRGISNRSHSDSRLELCPLKTNNKFAQSRKGKSRKNLIKELDEELNINGCRVALGNTITEKDGPQISDVGFDTQAAAEAMEALCQGEVIDFRISDAQHCLQNASKDAPADVENDSIEPKKRKKNRCKLKEELAKSSRSNKTMNHHVQEEIGEFVPIARRTRRSLIVNQHVCVEGSENATSCYNSDMNGKLMVKDLEHNSVVLSDRKSDAVPMSSEQNLGFKESPETKSKPSNSLAATPDNCKTPMNDASPVCMGDEYYKKYFKKNPSKPCMQQEIQSLSSSGPLLSSTPNVSRKRKYTTGIRVLYSHHLNDDIVKRQKKILSRLGISMASSITDATHFIADKFVRTRNMLEAIARSKPVVTHSWIENCGQANCFIDVKNHILRDTKKEKEFGFCLPVSLARAANHPLLQGQRVFITENTKPGKEIISSLVKAVNGQAVERIGRSALKNDKIPQDLLVLSCEEDYEICVPFLEKGAAIYSSELLLNGIVIQKLEFERHRLFADHIRRTRSTIWLKKDGNKFHPVAKSSY